MTEPHATEPATDFLNRLAETLIESLKDPISELRQALRRSNPDSAKLADPAYPLTRKPFGDLRADEHANGEHVAVNRHLKSARCVLRFDLRDAQFDVPLSVLRRMDLKWDVRLLGPQTRIHNESDQSVNEFCQWAKAEIQEHVNRPGTRG